MNINPDPDVRPVPGADAAYLRRTPPGAAPPGRAPLQRPHLRVRRLRSHSRVGQRAARRDGVRALAQQRGVSRTRSTNTACVARAAPSCHGSGRDCSSAATRGSRGSSTALNPAARIARSTDSAGRRTSEHPDGPPSPRTRGQRVHRGWGRPRPRFHADVAHSILSPAWPRDRGQEPGTDRSEGAVTVQEILARLERVSKTPTGWMARCPAHEDSTPEPQRRGHRRRARPAPLLRGLRAGRDRRGAADRGPGPVRRAGGAARPPGPPGTDPLPAPQVPQVAAWLRKARALPEPEVGLHLRRRHADRHRRGVPLSGSRGRVPLRQVPSARRPQGLLAHAARASERPLRPGRAAEGRSRRASSSWKASSISTPCARSGSRPSSRSRTAPGRA